jgi:hypothetical protein
MDLICFLIILVYLWSFLLFLRLWISIVVVFYCISQYPSVIKIHKKSCTIVIWSMPTFLLFWIFYRCLFFLLHDSAPFSSYFTVNHWFQPMRRMINTVTGFVRWSFHSPFSWRDVRTKNTTIHIISCSFDSSLWIFNSKIWLIKCNQEN